MVRLIRSKGVGVYFVTQNPLDVPDGVLAQLGNRIQHALRAYTPREQKAVKTAADTFRANPEFDTGAAITALGVGEALVSTLGEGGVPGVVERTLVRPPSSRLGPISAAERMTLMQGSPVAGRYDRVVDRESAYERLAERAGAKQTSPVAKQEETLPQSEPGFQWPDFGTGERAPSRSRGGTRSSNRQTVAEAAVKSVVRSMGSSLGRALVRGVLGSFKR